MYGWINSLVTSICYILFCSMFIDTFTGRRNGGRWQQYLLLISAVILMSLACIGLSRWLLLKQIIVIIVTFFAMYVCFHETLGKIMLFVLLFHSMSGGLDFISYQIVLLASRQLEEALLQLPAFGLLWIVLTQLLIFLFLILVKWVFAKRTSLNLTRQEWIKVIAFTAFSIVSLVEMFVQFGVVQNGMQGRVFLFLAIGLLCMNVLFFSLIQGISVRDTQLQEERIFRERVKSETERYHSISEQYVIQKRREHEYKNQITCMAALIKNENYRELQSYIHNLNTGMLAQMDYIDTDHVIVNAVLNTKYQEIRERDIAFVLKFNNLSDVDMEDEDLVVILSNLLNNAIEACEMCSEKVIRFKFFSDEEWITIAAANSCAVEPKRIGNKFQTSKTDETALHGIGIENIKEAVKKYQGTYLIDYENQVFRFVIRIPRKRVLDSSGLQRYDRSSAELCDSA